MALTIGASSSVNPKLGCQRHTEEKFASVCFLGYLFSLTAVFFFSVFIVCFFAFPV